MMSKEANENLKRDTQYVPLRLNAEEKVRGRGQFVYYESIKRELTRLAYTGARGLFFSFLRNIFCNLLPNRTVVVGVHTL